MLNHFPGYRVVVALALTAVAVPAIARFEGIIPVIISMQQTAAVAGQSLPVAVTLSGTPATSVVVSSSPSGVSWSGTVTGGSANVSASTNSALRGPVTVYVTSGGQSVSKTVTFVGGESNVK